MENNDNLFNGTPPETSKFDKFFGTHFKSLVVGTLLVLLIIGFTLITCITEKIDSEVVTYFTGATLGLIGFFAGAQSNKD